MDFNLIAAAIVGENTVAKSNPSVAKAIVDLIKSSISPLLNDFGPDFGHDALSSGLRGMSSGEISFPVRPSVFDKENLNGSLLVKVSLDPPVEGSGSSIANLLTVANFKVCYYFKTPKLGEGHGKCMWDVPAGEVMVSFDASGNPEIEDTGDLATLVEAMEQLAERVVESPPEGARSFTRDPVKRRETREMNEQARQFKEEKAREEEQARVLQEQRDADSATHGSVEAFLQYMDDQDDDEFGPADLQKLMNTMFKDPASRAVSQGPIRDQLIAEGLEWKPGKRILSMGIDLVKIAALVASPIGPIVLDIDEEETPQPPGRAGLNFDISFEPFDWDLCWDAIDAVKKANIPGILSIGGVEPHNGEPGAIQVEVDQSQMEALDSAHAVIKDTLGDSETVQPPKPGDDTPVGRGYEEEHEKVHGPWPRHQP